MAAAISIHGTIAYGLTGTHSPGGDGLSQRRLVRWDLRAGTVAAFTRLPGLRHLTMSASDLFVADTQDGLLRVEPNGAMDRLNPPAEATTPFGVLWMSSDGRKLLIESTTPGQRHQTFWNC